MSPHSLVSIQFNTARVVAILTPHLTARAACILSRFIMPLLIYEESRAEGFPKKHRSVPAFHSIKFISQQTFAADQTLVRINASR
jgi:hypothetical protein